MTDRYQWDSLKARENFCKHGVLFEQAAEALTDTNGVIIFDQANSQEEDRFRWIGMSSEGILLVIFTDRYDSTAYRIISARYATRKERRIYYAQEKN